MSRLVLDTGISGDVVLENNTSLRVQSINPEDTVLYITVFDLGGHFKTEEKVFIDKHEGGSYTIKTNRENKAIEVLKRKIEFYEKVNESNVVEDLLLILEVMEG